MNIPRIAGMTIYLASKTSTKTLAKDAKDSNCKIVSVRGRVYLKSASSTYTRVEVLH